jgi:hypothetical protein
MDREEAIIRGAAARLFDEAFTAAGWTENDLHSYDGWCLREGVIATAAGGEAAAMRKIIGAHTMTLPQLDPETGQVTDPLLDRCMEVIAGARRAAR